MGSPMSPTRPHSLRRRQSMQVLELQAKVEQLMMENRRLADGKVHAEFGIRQRAEEIITEQKSRHEAALANRQVHIESLQREVDSLKEDVGRLAEVNEGLSSATSQLAVQHTQIRQLENKHRSNLTSSTASPRELEFDVTEMARLRSELDAARDRIRGMQRQMRATVALASDDFLSIHDDTHFADRCRQLFSHARQWVLRFSKFSDMRACRLTREIDDEKTVDRLDNSMVDGSDVDSYLRDRVRRRDVFLSMTASMLWEFVFTRYLFGMDREQRQKIKGLERQLADCGGDPDNNNNNRQNGDQAKTNSTQAVRQWRARTLTLWTRRPAFTRQCQLDTEAVVQAIFQTLSRVLPPPSNKEEHLQQQLRRVVGEAVALSVEMRTQLAEYVMLPPLQPEYNDDGDLIEPFFFDAGMMSDAAEAEADIISRDELQKQAAVVRMVLFPAVVKRGDDVGGGEQDKVIVRAEVLVARDARLRVVTGTEATISPASFGAAV